MQPCFQESMITAIDRKQLQKTLSDMDIQSLSSQKFLMVSIKDDSGIQD